MTSKISQVIIWSVTIVCLALLVVKSIFIGYYVIPQNGMYPGLPAGSSIFAIKRAYSTASNVKRGDIIVFMHEENGQRYNYPQKGVKTSFFSVLPY